jgi:hypothetical protein
MSRSSPLFVTRTEEKMQTQIEAEKAILGYRDHDRQEYADRAPIPDAGEFNIGCFNQDGSPAAPGGEFG